MVNSLLKRILPSNDEIAEAPLPQAKTFAAGGHIGELHERLRNELGLDWDDPIVSEQD